MVTHQLERAHATSDNQADRTGAEIVIAEFQLSLNHLR